MIEIVIISFLAICTFFLLFLYLRLKKAVHSYENIGTGRYGFYKTNNVIVYIVELDRYKDGFSKIKMDDFEAYNLASYENKTNFINKAKKNFISLKLTSEIEWLESEDALRKMRKEKLDKIKKL